MLPGPSPRSLSRDSLAREGLFLRACRGPHPLLPCLPPWLPKQSISSAGLGATFPALTRQGGLSSEYRSCLRTRDLQRSPRRLLARHSSDVALCVCPRRDSCQRGWRLLYIVAAYHSCSEVLQPHLLRFLRDVSRTPGVPFQGEGPASGNPGLRASLRGDGLGSQQERKPRGPGPLQEPRQCLLRLIHSPDTCGGPTGADARGCLI